MRTHDHDFYQRLGFAVLIDAIEEAKGGNMGERLWLASECSDVFCYAAKLEPAYLKRIAPLAWKEKKQKPRRKRRAKKNKLPNEITNRLNQVIEALEKIGGR